MGIQINGQTDTITAVDGSFTLGGSVTANVTTTSGTLTVGTGATVHSPASNTLTLGTNSVERVRISSTGSVGIGTDNPQENLHIYNSSGSSRIRLTSGNSSDCSIFFGAIDDSATGGIQYNHSDDSLRFNGYNNEERLRITSSGLFGLGTNSPGALLNTRWTGTRAGSTGVHFATSHGDSSDYTLLKVSTSEGGADSKTKFLITGEGKIGVGTASPQNLFVVSNEGNDGIEINPIGENSDPAIYSYSRSGDGYRPLTFVTRDIRFNVGSSPSEKARIDDSGRLLVGTISDLSSNARAVFAGKSNGSADGQIEIRRNGATPTAGTQIGSILFTDSNASSGHYANIVVAADADSGSGSDLPGRLVFATTADGASSPTERVRIASDSSINFNIGVEEGFNIINSTVNNKTDFICVWNNGALNSRSNKTFQFRSNGAAYNSLNTWGSLSDEKLKENIVDSPSQWSDIKALQVRKYNFKKETGQETHTQIGLIAQEVELVSPGLVSETADRDEKGNDLGTTTKSVNYSVLYMKAVKALQEAQERIETLEAKVAALENS